jgi:peptidoglycan hydrolase CwlO-like protein
MPILADPLSDNLTRQNNQSSQSKVEDMEVSIEKMDSKIEKIYAEVDSAKVKISETEQQIKQSIKGIQVAQANIKEEEDLFNKRMRSMYMNGVDSYLEILLDSEGIEDLLSRVENIKKIVEYYNKITGELKAEKIKIEKVALETEKTKLLLLKADNEILSKDIKI